jgi:hypothetical protein
VNEDLFSFASSVCRQLRPIDFREWRVAQNFVKDSALKTIDLEALETIFFFFNCVDLLEELLLR